MIPTRVTTDFASGAVLARIGRWHREVKDLTGFWREKFAPRFLDDIQRNWDEEGEMVGGWPALSPAYAAWKAARWGAHLGILELSLRLRGSLQWLNAARGGDIGPEGIFQPGPKGAVIGTSVPYARRHQRGLGGLPERRFMFFEDSRDYDRLWKEWIADRAKRSGLHPE